MFASMQTRDASGGFSWRKIPIVRCETQDWWSKNQNKDLSESVASYFCLD